ncbi:MAG: SGNH/GDSL hydrolase family protein [Lachnospiraceae bacterium]|nr:SGNH/GDSL hydrolase family protein [Lachnospiraceae bacterium]
MSKKVFLIGDSIRLHYMEEVQRQLGEEYEVTGPAENCRFSAYVLNSLRFWLAECSKPDIIHWNVGLWDTAILYHEDGCFTSMEAYVSNMKKILRELKKTGAIIIFATTTPVTDDKKFLPGPMPPAHNNEDIVKYNKAVLDAFAEEDILVNDLFQVMYADKERLLTDDKIHPNKEGIEVLGNAVADVIRAQKCEGTGNNQVVEGAPLVRDEKTIQ